MKVKVIKCNSLKEAFEHMASLACADCKCKNRVPVNNHSDESITLRDVFEKIAKRRKCTVEDAVKFVNDIKNVSNLAAYHIMLKEIARMLDKKYVGHISESKDIFVISTFDSLIHKANKSAIKSYNNFAAFRTHEDAVVAWNLLRPQIIEMFPEIYGQ